MILESKTAELNQNKTSKKSNQPEHCENFILVWKQMNSTVNKTFRTCSTKSLFLRYKKISNKAVKLGDYVTRVTRVNDYGKSLEEFLVPQKETYKPLNHINPKFRWKCFRIKKYKKELRSELLLQLIL